YSGRIPNVVCGCQSYSYFHSNMRIARQRMTPIRLGAVWAARERALRSRVRCVAGEEEELNNLNLHARKTILYQIRSSSMGIQVTDLPMLRAQLVVRRKKLEPAVAKNQTANLLQLLEQVDRALERVEHGSYGVCETCEGAVEAERLFADPLTQLCLDCLKPAEQRALEQDLLLAARIQAGLLPKRDLSVSGWDVAYHYEPAGQVSGDYCDLIPQGRDRYF